MLHLANGESTALVLRATGLAGGIASADDILMEGPLPNALLNSADWRQRAVYLQDYLDLPADEYLRRAHMRQHLLARALEEDEAVLWFEEDVFCQLNYLQALSWLSSRAAHARISYVCPPTERLGELAEARLVELFEQRRPVPPELYELAARVWPLVAAPDPSALMSFIAGGDFAAWPLLRNGLLKQLARLPGQRDGLSALERAVLESVSDGATRFFQVFQNATRKVPEYGAGDMQFMRYLHDLAAEPAPLVALVTSNGSAPWSQDDWSSWEIMATELGQAVLRGERDYMTLGQPNRYVGGTHVAPGSVWRWNASEQRVVEV